VRIGITAVLATIVALGAVAAVAAHDDGNDADIKVAKLVNGKCGKLADSLPILISSTGARPGETVNDVTVCVSNNGDSAALLNLHVLELVDLDSACTGTESTLDLTCGGNQRGELSRDLLQQVVVGKCGSVPLPTNPVFDRRLTPPPASSLILVLRQKRKELVCVRLRLRYAPADSDAALASQSDRTTWRYAFNLLSRP
jgi:hypothetical protein